MTGIARCARDGRVHTAAPPNNVRTLRRLTRPASRCERGLDAGTAL